jgi:hypothetical protein
VSDVGDGGGGAAPSTQQLPCDVAPIVEQHCLLCHQDPPIGGAPMPLVSAADFRATDPTSHSPYYQLASQRISTSDPNTHMPPVSQTDLSAEERAVLSAWLDQGAPDDDGNTCPTSPGSEFGGGDGGTTSPGGSTTQGDGGTDPNFYKLVYDPIEPSDCEQSIELTAFDPDNQTQGFSVPSVQVDSYQCFTFDVPYDGKMQALKIDTIIGDARVLHHWLLYAQEGAVGKGYYNCDGQHPAAQLLGGWAPGHGSTVMPHDVGLQLPQKGSGSFVLEIHYNNSQHLSGVQDKSGARVCATSKLKKNEAAMHWLGTEAILLFPGAGQAVGTCTAPQNATVISSWPHMHLTGTHFTSVLTRKSGDTITLLDKPFSFDNQIGYDTPVILSPGDKIRSTCSYQNQTGNIIRFGTNSSDEMCYDFVLAYPVGSLVSGVSITGTNSVCIDPL